MIFAGERLVVVVRVPWRRYHGKGSETSVQVRMSARRRWRWAKLALTRPAEDMRTPGIFSCALEAKSWLTDESLRGNLRRKAFVRFKFRAGFGKRAEPGPRGCPARGTRGQPCTWERAHLPMLVTWPNREAPLEVPHSWACPKLAGDYVIVQEPRRERPSLFPRETRKEREFRAAVERRQRSFADLFRGVFAAAGSIR